MIVDFDYLPERTLVDGLNDFIAVGNVITDFILVKFTISHYNYSSSLLFLLYMPLELFTRSSDKIPITFNFY